MNVGNVSKEWDGIRDGELENVGDGVAVETNGQGFLIVTAAVTYLAEDINIRKEVHFNAALTVTLTGFASATLDVEGEAAWFVAALARLGKHGKEVADGGEDAGVGGGIGAGGASNGRLIDLDDLVELVDTDDGAVLAGLLAGAVELLGEGAVKDVVHKRRLAGAGDTGNDGHYAEGKVGGNVLEVVGVGVFDGDPIAGEGARAGFTEGVGRGG